MKICVIHGSPRKGNTYKATEIFKEELNRIGEYEFIEYFLPKDMPHFCKGCYFCFEQGENKCPHAEYTMPIAISLKEADGIIITSPVYVLSESGAVKNLLDHFAYLFIPHRPMEEMFKKIGIVISTTAGMGTGAAMKPISKSLKHWGVRRILKCGFGLWAKNWKDMKSEKQLKRTKTLQKKAKKFDALLKKKDKLRPYVYIKIMFGMMRKMHTGNETEGYDKNYWKEKGWLESKQNPF